MSNKITKYNFMYKDRYKWIGKYCFDRWIINAAMIIIFAYLFFVAAMYDFDLDYYSCQPPHEDFGMTNGSICHNPFYKPITWKNIEYLDFGEYGTKPGPLFKSVYYLPWVLLIIAFILNHYRYNKGKKINIILGDDDAHK